MWEPRQRQPMLRGARVSRRTRSWVGLQTWDRVDSAGFLAIRAASFATPRTGALLRSLAPRCSKADSSGESVMRVEGKHNSAHRLNEKLNGHDSRGFSLIE